MLSRPQIWLRPAAAGLVAALASVLASVGVANAAPTRGHPYLAPHIGSSIEIESYDEHLRITLLAVQDPASARYSFDKPRPGLKYVAVSLRIVNLSRDRYNDSPSNGARVITTDRAAYRITLPGKEPNLDEMAAIPPGGSHTGWLTFPIPARARLSRFRFILDSGFVPQRGEWLLR